MRVMQTTKVCTGCMACVVACREANRLAPGVRICSIGERVSFDEEAGRMKGEHLWQTCRQCDQAACQEVCPFDALVRDDTTGIIHVDRDRCRSCRLCVKACPYDAIVHVPSEGAVMKCELCGDRQPACVAACPLHLLSVG